MSIKSGSFKCPKCGENINYSINNIKKSKTKNGRLKCRVSWCDYILTEEESSKIRGEVFAKAL